MVYKDEQLKQFQVKLREEKPRYEEAMANNYQDTPFEDFFIARITDTLLKTMALDYDALSQTLSMQIIRDNMDTVKHDIVRYMMAPEAYLEFCERVLGLNRNSKFNDSANQVINGVPIRVFAIMPPYKHYPLVVMSTAKVPPKKINHLSEQDEQKLKMVLRDNFLIAGKSGAGKTYLLNYLLSKYFPKDARVGIIQEFMEIYSPNEFTDQITVPPVKPGQQWNDLQFLTEQSNLMRYDHLLVGELKGGEAWPFVVNLASGTRGGATIHGTSIQNALQRLRMMCLLGASNLNTDAVDSFIKDAVTYVVYVENAQVKEIGKLVTVNKGKFSYESI